MVPDEQGSALLEPDPNNLVLWDLADRSCPPMIRAEFRWQDDEPPVRFVIVDAADGGRDAASVKGWYSDRGEAEADLARLSAEREIRCFVAQGLQPIKEALWARGLSVEETIDLIREVADTGEAEVSTPRGRRTL